MYANSKADLSRNKVSNLSTYAGDGYISMKKHLATREERVEVLLEDMNGKFDFIVENVSSLHVKVDNVEGGLRKVSDDTENMKTDIEIIKMDLGVIKNNLKQKVDREGFVNLEKRVGFVEKQARLKRAAA